MLDFNAKKTLVILLGAEEWPGCPTLGGSYPPDNNPFQQSVTAIERYFRTLGIEKSNLKSWFNSELEASLVVGEIGKFITDRTSQIEVTDIFFYYVGHGDSTTLNNYCLLVRSTQKDRLLLTAIQIGQLYEIIKNDAKNSRCYLILDACFSEAACDSFPSVHQTGVLLFCSSGKHEPSVLTEKQDFTLFTRALLTTLDKGNNKLSERLSFYDLRELVQVSIDAQVSVGEIRSKGNPPRCGLHASSRTIEKIEIFPNPSYPRISVSSDSLLVVGVNVGTTGIRAGLVEIPKNPKLQTTERPHILYSKQVKHDEIRKTIRIRDRVGNIIRDVLAGANIDIKQLDRVGIGMTGQVDCTTGLLKFAHGLRFAQVSLCDFNVRADLHNLLGLEREKIFVDNDVNCSTLAELYYGGHKYQNFVCVFIGSGIGSGIVIDGKLIRGHHFAAGEVGHMKIDSSPNARKCNCGGKGCFEEYASARAIIRLAREKIRELRDQKQTSSLLELNPDSITTESIAKLVDSEDVYCRELAAQIANYLAIGIANIANVINPEAIILGGGIIEGFYKFDFFKSAIRSGFKKASLEVCAMTDIIETQLDPVLGAASLNEYNLKQ
jgi:glucokinase